MSAHDVDLFGESVALSQDHPGIGSHHSASSVTDEWLTPPDLLASLGTFDLDPCSPGDRRPWDTALVHYGTEDDGLGQPWRGRVWLNPPYSDAAPWLSRLAQHGHGTALIYARTETASWFRWVWPRATGVLFLQGRLYFHYVTGKRAPFNCGAPSALVAYGQPDAEVLAEGPVPGHYVAL